FGSVKCAFRLSLQTGVGRNRLSVVVLNPLAITEERYRKGRQAETYSAEIYSYSLFPYSVGEILSRRIGAPSGYISGDSHQLFGAKIILENSKDSVAGFRVQSPFPNFINFNGFGQLWTRICHASI